MRPHGFIVARTLLPLIAAGTLLSIAGGSGCQKRGEPELSLTQEQWRRVRENILTELPDDETLQPISAQFGDALQLVAVRPDVLHTQSGNAQEIVLYWKVLRPAAEGYRMQVVFDAHQQEETHEYLPMDGQLDTRDWVAGDIIVDRVRYHAPLTINGRAQLRIVVFDGQTRLDEVPTDGQRVHPKGVRIGESIITWTPPRLISVYTDQRILLDGHALEPAWKTAPPASPMLDPITGAAFPGQPTSIQSLWNDDGLFFYLKMTDAHIWATHRHRDSALWEEENIELFLDPGRDGRDYLEVQVSPANVVFDALFPTAENRDLDSAKAHTIQGLKTAAHVQGTLNREGDNDAFWSVELFVPFAAMPGFARRDDGSYTPTGVNLYRYDRPLDAPAEVSAWAPVGRGSFHQPARFGELRLITSPAPDGGAADSGAPAGPTEGAPAEDAP